MAEFKIDAETRERLKGLLPFSNDAVDKFTPEFYNEDWIPKEVRPVFKIRPYTMEEKRELMQAKDKDQDPYAKIKKVIVGWENLIDIATGSKIEYKKTDEELEDSLFNLLPQPALLAILNHAFKISGLLDIDKLSLKY